jgi:tripartite ATP-independent transporter DctP family solute receptor
MDVFAQSQVSRRDLLRGGGLALGAAALGGPLLLGGCAKKTKSSAGGGTSGGGKTVNLRYAHVFNAGTDQANIIQSFAERVKSLTNGEVNIQVYPSSQLGSDTETTQQAQQGAIDMVGTSTAVQNAVPALGLFYLPYLYKDTDHFNKIWTVGKSETAKYMSGLIESKMNLRPMGFLTSGVRDTICRKKPINVAGDFKGVKMRTDGSQLSHDTFAALGATTVFVNYNEVYQALKSGVIDGADNPTIYFVSLKWDESAKYVSLTGHQVIMQVQAINKAKWDSLSKDQQSAMQQAMDETVVKFNQSTASARSQSITTLKSSGVHVNEISDLSSFQNATKPMISQFVSKYSLQTYFDEIQAAAT